MRKKIFQHVSGEMEILCTSPEHAAALFPDLGPAENFSPVTMMTTKFLNKKRDKWKVGLYYKDGKIGYKTAPEYKEADLLVDEDGKKSVTTVNGTKVKIIKALGDEHYLVEVFPNKGDTFTTMVAATSLILAPPTT